MAEQHDVTQSSNPDVQELVKAVRRLGEVVNELRADVAQLKRAAQPKQEATVETSAADPAK
jgi:hypothetical protein